MSDNLESAKRTRCDNCGALWDNHEIGLPVVCESSYEELEQQLAASEAEKIKGNDANTLLRRQLASSEEARKKAEADIGDLQRLLLDMRQRAEAAEQRIKDFERRCEAGYNKLDWLDANERVLELEQRIRESQEQEPVAWIYEKYHEGESKERGNKSYMSFWTSCKEIAEAKRDEEGYEFVELYSKPIIPTSLEELQRENEVLRASANFWQERAGQFSEEIVELRKQLEAKVPNGWQPIETAPKDGTILVVGYFPKRETEFACFCAVDYYRTGKLAEKSGFTGWGKFSKIYHPATHWMPLPAAPKEE